MIHKIILNNYNRFFLNNITRIEYTPKLKLQLILGSNGSGKSSLISELNPLPINKNDFQEDGYKEYYGEKDGNHFIIKSNTSKSSFIKNDIELNPGGTKKVQLSLIREYYNLTPRYNNVVLGTEKLTTMSTNDRKNYLREMSTVDYTYGIYLYNTLKQQLRDAVGFLKVITVELNNDIAILVPDNELDILKQDIFRIKNIIEQLVSSYQKVDNVKELKYDNTLLGKLKSLKESNIQNLNIDRLKEELSNSEFLLNNINKEIDTLNEEIDTLNNYSKISNDTILLKENISILEEYFDNLRNQFKEDLPFDKNTNLYENYLVKYTDITNTILELSNYDDFNFTGQEHLDLKAKRDVLFNRLNILKNIITGYEKELEIFKNNKVDDNMITCKKCGDISYFGYDENKEEVTKKLLLEKQDKYDSINKDYQEVLNTIGKQETKIQLLANLRNTYMELNLQNLWNYQINDYIKDKDIEKKNITSLTSSMLAIIDSLVSKTLEAYKDYGVNSKSYNDLSYQLKIDNEIIALHLKKQEEDIDKLLGKLTTLTTKKQDTISNIIILKQNIVKYQEYTTITASLENLVLDYSKNKKNIVITNKNTIIKNSINELKDLLIILEDKYNNIDKIKNRIENNKKLIEQYEKERDALTAVVRALSPTEGLIAKSINSFINVFLNEMNTIINSVWSYDITLLPCQVNNDNDLDYMFRVEVDNKKTIGDVSLLSSSMKDIVDLSFKIVFMKYMNLTHMPLILDEFGITMDDKHRNKVYHVIENVLSNNFSQIYFTANFKSIYGRFIDSEIVILDDKNLEIENLSYNSNIKITN